MENHITYYGDDFILKKSKTKNDIFDVIIFARINIEKVIIPSFIKKIAPYAFYNCKKIKQLIFQDDMKLETIEKYAFSNSSIDQIIISSPLQDIKNVNFNNENI